MIGDLASDEQRWTIFNLFGRFGISEVEEIRVNAQQMLKLEYLPDLREMSAADAAELISELRRALAVRLVGE